MNVNGIQRGELHFMNRRQFIGNCSLILAATQANALKASTNLQKTMLNQLKVIHTGYAVEKEKLRFPFGFKGAFLTELWQAVSYVKDLSGNYGVGLGTQSVLYGDADTFASTDETTGNSWMLEVSKTALKWLENKEFNTPMDAIEQLVPYFEQEGKKITKRDNLHVNFIYNALVSVDNALWMLYGKKNKVESFQQMIPGTYRSAFQNKNKQVAVMFQISYNMPLKDIAAAVDQGYFVFKIKTGSPGAQQVMLKQDKARLKEIHDCINSRLNNQSNKKSIYYTMDANGRYERKADLSSYLDYAKEIGAFDRILLYEEPFVEENQERVDDLPVLIGADESIHSEADAYKKIELGYKAFILKGIAKTLSLTVKIAKIAHENNIPCLCSDLTVNPVLMEWNKIIAASLSPFPIVNMGLMETNGDMNYLAWEAMKERHPFPNASWTKVENGTFHLNEDFFEKIGGIMTTSAHYQKLLQIT